MNDIQANTLNLVAGMAANQAVACIYTDQDGVTSFRHLVVNSIERADNGHTIVHAYDRQRRADRQFRIENFSIVMTPDESVL